MASEFEVEIELLDIDTNEREWRMVLGLFSSVENALRKIGFLECQYNWEDNFSPYVLTTARIIKNGEEVYRSLRA